MPRWLNILIQVSATIAQVWQITSEAITWEDAQKIGAAIAALQVVVAALAHSYNPDGTPAAVAYTPPKP